MINFFIFFDDQTGYTIIETYTMDDTRLPAGILGLGDFRGMGFRLQGKENPRISHISGTLKIYLTYEFDNEIFYPV